MRAEGEIICKRISGLIQAGFGFDEDLADFKIIAIVTLLEKRDLSDDEILGGFLVWFKAQSKRISLAWRRPTRPTIRRPSMPNVESASVETTA